MKVTKAIIPAAGLGTRMYPYTKVESKLLIPVLNKPVIEYLLEELTASGIKEVVIISDHLSSLKRLFKEDKKLDAMLKRLKKGTSLNELHHVEVVGKNIDWIKQDKPYGWMHEVLHAHKFIKNEPFLVCFSDVLYRSKVPAAKQVIDAFKKYDKNILARARFVFKPYIMDIAKHEKYSFGKDVADIDIYNQLMKTKDFKVVGIEGDFYDVGDTFSCLKTETVFGLHNKEFGKKYKKFLKTLVK